MENYFLFLVLLLIMGNYSMLGAMLSKPEKQVDIKKKSTYKMENNTKPSKSYA